MSDAIHLWLNIAVLFVFVGLASFFSCLSSTTWYDD